LNLHILGADSHFKVLNALLWLKSIQAVIQKKACWRKSYLLIKNLRNTKPITIKEVRKYWSNFQQTTFYQIEILTKSLHFMKPTVKEQFTKNHSLSLSQNTIILTAKTSKMSDQ
jgi:hypothetical protein